MAMPVMIWPGQASRDEMWAEAARGHCGLDAGAASRRSHWCVRAARWHVGVACGSAWSANGEESTAPATNVRLRRVLDVADRAAHWRACPGGASRRRWPAPSMAQLGRLGKVCPGIITFCLANGARI